MIIESLLVPPAGESCVKAAIREVLEVAAERGDHADAALLQAVSQVLWLKGLQAPHRPWSTPDDWTHFFVI